MRTVALPDGTRVPALGLGTWFMGEGRQSRREEAAALQLGIDLGATLIDTAEMYADGGAEQVVGDAIAGRRDRVFLVSKVYPHNASHTGVPSACERSLQRLRTDRIDLYLLHWRGNVPLTETVAAFEALRAQGKIRHWGVSNFDVDDLEELNALRCATNQILYNPDHRGIEFDLLPWSAQHGLPLMAYSPIGQAGSLLKSPALGEVARRHHVTPAQIALAWCLRHENVIAIPKATDPSHVRANVAALQIMLSPEDLRTIDAAHPPPKRKQRLAML